MKTIGPVIGGIYKTGSSRLARWWPGGEVTIVVERSTTFGTGIDILHIFVL